MAQLTELMRKLAAVGGSELLLSAGRPPLYRGPHALSPLAGADELSRAELQAELEQLLAPDDWQRLRADHQTAFVAELGAGQRVRGSCHVSAQGYTLKLSWLDAESDKLSELELPQLLEPLLAAESGLIVITGPADSGKSTLLAQLVSQLASERPLSVATSENPVEYKLHSDSSLIVQRSVGRHVASHALAIETALSTNAQLIACSDLTAPGALERLLEAACSGVLALGELSGRGSVHALEQLALTASRAARPRLLGELADCLLAVVGLELLPHKQGGSALALELLLSSRNVCNAIRDDKLSLLPGLLEREAGMQSMDRSLLELATRGAVDGREALRRASDKRLLSAWG